MKKRLSRLSISVRGLVGYTLDLADFARMRLRNPRGLTKFRLIEAVRRETGATSFIEAGSLKGVTALRCAARFERVITIELDDDRFRDTKALLEGTKNATALHGDALKVLPEVLARPDVDRALVFLDGHFSGQGTSCTELPEPAVEELDALAPHAEKISAIVIDDFRAFGQAPGFPKKSALLQAAESLFEARGFELRVQYDQLILLRPRA